MARLKEEEYNEIMLYVAELRRKFNRKLDEHLYLMEQQTDRIEFQQQQIQDQRHIIEELAWQIRDLRDTMQRFTGKSEIPINFDNKPFTRNSTLDSCASMADDERSQNQSQDLGSLYESINYELPQRALPTAAQRTKINKLLRQDALHGKCDMPNVVNRCDVTENQRERLPTPPNTSPPRDDDDDSDREQGEIDNVAATFDKLNKLYEMRTFVRNSSIEADHLDDVIYRFRDMKDLSRCTRRESSKALCSFISDIEVDYLPHNDEDEHNKETNPFKVDAEIQLRHSEMPSDDRYNIKRSPNAEVYI